MGQVSVNVNGRSYRFDCGDGEEERLKELAAYVKGRLDALVREYGKVGDERLLLTAALLIADELLDARAALAQANEVRAAASGAPPSPPPARAAAEPQDPVQYQDPYQDRDRDRDREETPAETPRRTATSEA